MGHHLVPAPWILWDLTCVPFGALNSPFEPGSGFESFASFSGTNGDMRRRGNGPCGFIVQALVLWCILWETTTNGPWEYHLYGPWAMDPVVLWEYHLEAFKIKSDPPKPRMEWWCIAVEFIDIYIYTFGIDSWWFCKYIGESFPLTNIFQRGWNHQPVMFFASHLYIFVCEINMLDVIQSELQPIMAKKHHIWLFYFHCFFLGCNSCSTPSKQPCHTLHESDTCCIYSIIQLYIYIIIYISLHAYHFFMRIYIRMTAWSPKCHPLQVQVVVDGIVSAGDSWSLWPKFGKIRRFGGLWFYHLVTTSNHRAGQIITTSQRPHWKS